MVSHEEILDLYAGAEIVVVQGGPGSIIDALSTGHIPIAVPRRANLHEVVDDHQVEFVRQMARQGQAVVVETKESLWTELEHAMREPGAFCAAPRPSGSTAAALRLGRAVEEMRNAPVGVVSLRRIGQLLAHR